MAGVSELPGTMSGVIIEKTGGTEVLQYKTDLPVPKPKEGEVIVKNEYIGLNYIDTYFRSGLYKVPSFPYILGREAAGKVAATGTSASASAFSPGDSVVWLGEQAYAEYTAVAASKVVRLPTQISTASAAAAILQGLTALTMIRETHPVKKGDWVLVHAAAGGVGLLLVQLLKAVGAHTIATASTAEKREIAKEAGAEVLIDYGSGSGFKDKVMEVTKGEGVVAVFDGVGKKTFDESLECVARKGSMVSFGNASGAVDPFTIARLAPKCIKLARPMLNGYIATSEEQEHYTKEIFDFISKGQLHVKVHGIYPLKDIAKVHEELEGRKTMGKVLLTP